MASLWELALIEGPFAAGYLFAIGAIAVGAIHVDPTRARLATNCFGASAFIFATVGMIWGINSHMGMWPRSFIVFFLCGVAGIAAVETARFIREQSTGKEVQTPTPQPDLELSQSGIVYTLDWRPPFGLRIYIKQQGQEETEAYYNPIFLIKNNSPSILANAVSVRWRTETSARDVEDMIRTSPKFTPYQIVVKDHLIALQRPRPNVYVDEPVYKWKETEEYRLPTIASSEQIALPYSVQAPALFYLIQTMPEEIGKTTNPFVYSVEISWQYPLGGTPRKFLVKVSATNIRTKETSPYWVRARLNFSVERIE